MKRVLVVSASFRGGGSERLAVEFANTAVMLGYNVTYFVGISEGPYLNELNPSIKLVEGGKKNFSLSLFKLSKLYSQNKIDSVFCSQEYVISIVYLARLFSNSKPFLIGREASTPSINLLESKTNLKLKLLKAITRFSYDRVDKLIVPTISVENDLHNFYGITRQLDVIPNPVDANRLHELALNSISFNFDKKNKYFIVVGRLVKSKGVDTIIKAIHLLNTPNYHLIILGEGEHMVELIHLVNTLELIKQVHFLGFQKNPFPFILKSDIFISASKYEGMPNSLIQAIALNTPCLSTLSTSAVSTLLKEERIFPFQDEIALVTCILDTLTTNVEFCDKLIDKFLTPSEYVTKVLEIR
ncbi:glycosyltransferase [Colwellia psychrerythraea]|uniref:Glycosyl transferase group 1 n=1 Tax=Colwellia psychrerythraea TaxID=28229 RepID=A0A099KHR0_COLPS|nr:glycosyltransferase [Colwellia psychrerythraea]KGJ89906.1 glycosyl transferase group 1 [Colwellia psychrerythraea]